MTGAKSQFNFDSGTNDGVLPCIPDSWMWVRLDDIADVVGGVTKDVKKQSDPAIPEVPYLRVANVQRGRLDLRNVARIRVSAEKAAGLALKPGDVLLNEGGDRDKLGRGWIWDGQIDGCIHQNHVFRARIHCGILDPKLLAWHANEFGAGWCERNGKQSVNLASISLSKMKMLPVPVPPLAEQRRIVAALDEYLTRFDAADRLLQSVVRRCESIQRRITESFSGGGLDASPMEVAPPPSMGVTDGVLPTIPSSWKWFRLGDIADVVGGVTKDSKKQSDDSLPEVPYLRVANVQRGRLDLREISRIRVPENTVAKLSLQVGDVLLNEGGDRDKLGRGWVWEGQIAGCIHQNHVFRARIRDGILHPKLLAWHANGFGQAWCERNGKQSVNLASISLSKIKLMPIPVPPAEIQEIIVQHVDGYLTDLGHAEAQARRALESTSHLRRSLLSEAFAGRLVEQDPADEPASVLLERIRAERAAGVGSVPRGRGRAKKTTHQDVLL